MLLYFGGGPAMIAFMHFSVSLVAAVVLVVPLIAVRPPRTKLGFVLWLLVLAAVSPAALGTLFAHFWATPAGTPLLHVLFAEWRQCVCPRFWPRSARCVAPPSTGPISLSDL